MYGIARIEMNVSIGPTTKKLLRYETEETQTVSVSNVKYWHRTGAGILSGTVPYI